LRQKASSPGQQQDTTEQEAKEEGREGRGGEGTMRRGGVGRGSSAAFASDLEERKIWENLVTSWLKTAKS